jgi:hypothetical protein
MCDLCWKYREVSGADGLFKCCPYCGEKYSTNLDTSKIGDMRLAYTTYVNKPASQYDISIERENAGNRYSIAFFMKDPGGEHYLQSVGDRVIDVDPEDFHEIVKRGFEYLKRLEITEDEEL